MTINSSLRTSSICQSIPANVCKHPPIMNAFSLCISHTPSSSLKSRTLNKILSCSDIKGLLHRKEVKKTLIEGFKNLHAHTPDINNNIYSTHEAAKDCFRKVASYGYPIGDFLLGDMYIQYADTLEDQEKGIAHLLKAAKKNHLQACLSLAEIYTYKAQSDLNYKAQAIEYYKKAGKLGSSEGYLKLAEIFQDRSERSFSRKNANTDHEKAIKYYKKAGELGSCTAYLNIANIFQNRARRKQFPDSQEKAIKYYKKAGKLGSSQAYLELAELYANHNDCAQAIAHYEKASDLGCQRSSLALGRNYLYGYMTEQNFDKAIYFLQKAGNLRSATEDKICSWKNASLPLEEKYFYLAEIFRDSATVEKDPSLKKTYTDKALIYYQQAGLLGCAEAYLRLSSMHSYDVKLENNKEKSIEYLEKASLLGSSIASSRLKTIYTELAQHHLINDNLQQAVIYYEKAGSHGSTEAYFLLGEMCLSGRILVEIDLMIQYYKKAADKSHAQACSRLFELYSYGIAGYIDPNTNEARKYAHKAHNSFLLASN